VPIKRGRGHGQACNETAEPRGEKQIVEETRAGRNVSGEVSTEAGSACQPGGLLPVCPSYGSSTPQRCRKGETPHSRIALIIEMPYWSATQSASTSTNHSRLMNPLTSTKVVAGRIAAKNSPCARAAASHCDTSVNMIHVRTTVSRERPASTTASAMISRQRLVWP